VVGCNPRTGGNITGAAFFSTTLAAKRLELVRQLVPAADGVALLVNPNNVESVNEARDLQAAAQAGKS
jgi:putative tryptophan/tyrosine transport system substrate-binding protein